MRQRSRARVWAFKALFAWEIKRGDLLEEASCLLDHRQVPPGRRQYTLSLLEAVREHLVEIDECLQEHTLNWDLDRLTTVDRTILRLATAELMFLEDIPYRVAIDEAIELAKCYGTADSAGFVNGVLDAISKKVRSGETRMARTEGPGIP